MNQMIKNNLYILFLFLVLSKNNFIYSNDSFHTQLVLTELSEEQVMNILGEPKGKVKSGKISIWSYPGGTIKFENGKVIYFDLKNVSPSQHPVQDSFDTVLEKASMQFNLPDNFTTIPIIDNPHVSYNYAITSTSSDIEIRYKIQPYPIICKGANYSLIPPDEKVFKGLLQAIIENLKIGNVRGFNKFPDDAVKHDFKSTALQI